MNNEIIISNITPQDIIIEGGGSTIGLTAVYVNGVNVTVGSVAYVIVPTKLSELKNNVGYITSETDPTVPTYIKQITMSDITSWNNKQNLLVSGTNIKTINNNSILGSGNLDISTSYTAGTGIEITEENVINNTITSYNDLTDRPTIPTHTSDLINNSNFVNGNSLSQVAYTGDYYDLIGKPDLSEYITKYVDNLVNYYTKDFMYGLLPKVSDEDTSITLNNTYPSELKLSLSPSELSQDDTPTPDNPQEIHTISGNNSVVVEGKNLFDKDNANIRLGRRMGLNGISIVDNDYFISDYIEIKPSTQYSVNYTMSVYTRIAYYDKDKIFISDNSSLATFTTPSNAKYLILGNLQTKLNNVQIEKGSTATDYEPYVSQTSPINLGNIEYCKIGNYEDIFFKNVISSPLYNATLELDKWYLKKNIGKVVFTGANDEYWWKHGNGYFATQIYDNLYGRVYCNYFKSNSNTSTDLTCYSYSNGYFEIRYNAMEDVTAFKTWLSTHNTEVRYPLSTSTYTLLNDTLQEQLEYIYNQMLSYQGQTNISQVNNDLPFVISASALLDLNTLVGGN